MRKKTLNLGDLFVAPNFDEVRSLALSANGSRKRLTQEQLASIRETGEFEVISAFVIGNSWDGSDILSH